VALKPARRWQLLPGKPVRRSADRVYSAMPRQSKSSRRTSASLLEDLVAGIDGRVPGTRAGDTIPTGFPSLDRLLGGGMRRQDLVVLAGDVGSGKSALGLAIALRAAGANIPTLYFSGEMSPQRVFERALAIEGRVPVDDLRQGRLDDSARASVGAAAVRLRHQPVIVQALTGATFDEVRAPLEIVPRRQLVVLDSLHLMAAPRRSARLQERIATSIRALKSLALERDLVLLTIAQLPLLRRDRPDPRPTLEDLGAMGTIKQTADVTLLLYREEMYRPAQGVEGAAELILAKNRNGSTGFVDLYFYSRWLRFVDMLDAD
jgi:replicative DNA helicase